MKKEKLMLVSLLSVLSFSLSSCQKRPYKIEAEGLEDWTTLFKEMMSKSLAQEDITVRWGAASTGIMYTERIKGTTEYLLEERTKDGSSTEYTTFRETWSFINEKGEKISATKTYFDENMTTKEEKSYVIGEEEYSKGFKLYCEPFNVAGNMDAYLKPNSKEGGEKDYSSAVEYSGYRYNLSDYNPEEEFDYFNFYISMNNEKHPLALLMHGNTDGKTDLLTKASILFDFPSEVYSPFDRPLKWFLFDKMSYGENEKIELPDISSWVNKTSP